MTHRGTSSSWRALLLVATCTTLGGVLLAVGLAPGADHSPSGTAGAGTTGAVVASGTSPRPERGSGVSPPSYSLSPIHLKIPVIDVATPLVRLGLAPDHTVEVPTNADRAGWFRRGPTPGRQGSAVILGHVDSPQGPAVFARLQELQPGDTVTVDRADGSTVRFRVRKSVMYANADFPAGRVYAAQGARRLNLVTCGGSYDSTRGGYQSNLVVYSRRANAARH